MRYIVQDNKVLDLLQTLQQTPLPTILVVSGIFFLFLSIAGGLSGKINVPPNRQKSATIFGCFLLVTGLAIYVIPPQSKIEERGSSMPGPDPVDNSRTITEGEAVSVKSFNEWPLIADETFTGVDSHWNTGTFSDEGSHFDIRVISGKYRWDVEFLKNWYRYQLSPYEPAIDFYVAVDMKLETNPPARISAGLVFRKTGDRDYRLYIHSDRYFILYYYQKGEFKPIIDWTYIPNLDPEKFNRIAILADGSLLQVFINDRLFGEIHDSSLSGGNVGVVMVSHEDTNIRGLVDFDNFEFRRKP